MRVRTIHTLYGHVGKAKGLRVLGAAETAVGKWVWLTVSLVYLQESRERTLDFPCSAGERSQIYCASAVEFGVPFPGQSGGDPGAEDGRRPSGNRPTWITGIKGGLYARGMDWAGTGDTCCPIE